jgi:hypothetical protein
MNLAKLTPSTRTLRYGLHSVPAYSGCFRLGKRVPGLPALSTSILSSGFSRVSKQRPELTVEHAAAWPGPSAATPTLSTSVLSSGFGRVSKQRPELIVEHAAAWPGPSAATPTLGTSILSSGFSRVSKGAG